MALGALQERAEAFGSVCPGQSMIVSHYYDGDKLSYLKAVVDVALHHKEYGN